MSSNHPAGHRVIGIDVGKGELFVAFAPTEPRTPIQQYPTLKIDLTDPTFWQRLIDLIAPDAIIAAEPTGAHLLTPIARLLEHFRPEAQLWQVAHSQTGRYRESYVAAAKNDRLDAIALYLIARDIARGQPPRNVRLYDPAQADSVQALRLRVNQHRRLTKETTRCKNRLHVLAHALFPLFAGSSTWRRAAEAGYYTCQDIQQLSKNLREIERGDRQFPKPYKTGQARNYLHGLAESIPPLGGAPATIEAITRELHTLNTTEQQLEALEQEIAAAINREPFAITTARWMTVPSAGLIAIASLHVATSGKATEMTVDEFCAAVGTNPLTSISGSRDKTTNPRRGYTPARVHLYLWTLNMVQMPENPIAEYFERQKARGKQRPIYAARTKLARILWGVAQSGPYKHRSQSAANPGSREEED